MGGRFIVTCRSPNGNLKWRAIAENLVFNAGLNHVLDQTFTGAASQVSTWYVGLIGSSPVPTASEVLSSHAWTEFATYDDATRPTFNDTRVSQTVDNSATTASFTLTSNSSIIGGAFLVSNSTKASETGLMLCGAAFSGGNKAGDDGDILNVTYSFTAADDGV